MRVLLVDNDLAFTEIMHRVLVQNRMTVDLATTAGRALDLLELNEYSVVVLDHNLPGASGEQICQYICQYIIDTWPHTKILMIGGQSTSDDLVRGLAAGADDYMAKPFSTSELIARVHTLNRRSGYTHRPILSGAGIRLDPISRSVTRNGTPLDLTGKEFALLRIFLRSPSEILSSDQLMERAWEDNSGSRPTSLRVILGRLRRKLGPPDPIQTVKGVGYRFDPSAEADVAGLQLRDQQLTEPSTLLADARDQFISRMIDELRGPIARLLLVSEILRQDYGNTPELSALIDSVSDATMDLRSLLLSGLLERNLLGDPEPVDVDVSFLVEQVQLSLNPLLEVMHTTTTVDIASDVLVRTNRPLLQILISNLLRNAVLHNVHDGDYLVRLSIANGTAVLNVVNSGAEVDPADLLAAQVQSRDADQFSVGQIRSQKSGLPLAYLIARMLGYSISIEPRETGGLSVILTAPLSPTTK